MHSQKVQLHFADDGQHQVQDTQSLTDVVVSVIKLHWAFCVCIFTSPVDVYCTRLVTLWLTHISEISTETCHESLHVFVVDFKTQKSTTWWSILMSHENANLLN